MIREFTSSERLHRIHVPTIVNRKTRCLLHSCLFESSPEFQLWLQSIIIGIVFNQTTVSSQTCWASCDHALNKNLPFSSASSASQPLKPSFYKFISKVYLELNNDRYFSGFASRDVSSDTVQGSSQRAPLSSSTSVSGLGHVRRRREVQHGPLSARRYSRTSQTATRRASGNSKNCS